MSEGKKTLRRFKPSHFYSIVSTSLVLFMLGLLGMVFTSGNKLANQFKENLEFTVIIKDNIDEKKILDLKNELDKKPWVKSSEYVSKEEAAKKFIKETGEDFNDLLDYNPLYSSIEIKLYSQYTVQDTINAIEKFVTANPAVSEFYYEPKVVEMLNSNFRILRLIILGLSLIFIIVALTLIDSTIRLSMYANRFLIRSMQLVGATRSFITKPFLKRSISNGTIAALIAITFLFIFLKLATTQIPELNALLEINLVILIFLAIMFVGWIFSIVSTHFAVRKYLRMKIEELY